MKTTLNKIFCTLLCAVFSLTLSAQDKVDSIVGDWEYSATSAPAGYEKGVFKIKADSNKLTGEVEIGYSTVKINEIKNTDGIYTCTVYVDGYPVFITMKKKDEGFEGTADVDGDPIPITFKRIVKKEG